VKLEARESFYQGNRLVVRTRVSMFERGRDVATLMIDGEMVASGGDDSPAKWCVIDRMKPDK
jgi:hypothetical protein